MDPQGRQLYKFVELTYNDVIELPSTLKEQIYKELNFKTAYVHFALFEKIRKKFLEYHNYR